MLYDQAERLVYFAHGKGVERCKTQPAPALYLRVLSVPLLSFPSALLQFLGANRVCPLL